MSLEGIKVKYRQPGKPLDIGEIVEQGDGFVNVLIDSEIKKVGFPSGFERFYSAENPDDQPIIDAAINEAHREYEETRRIEEERRIADRGAEARRAFTAHLGDDYHAEHMSTDYIFTYIQVENIFGISRAGFGQGINVRDEEIVLISNINRVGGQFVYHDRWTADGDFIYSGEGSVGDQVMNARNRAIRDAKKDGKTIHLFIKLSPQEYYYQGAFELASYSLENERDYTGNLRKEYKFRLKRVAAATALD